MSEDPLLEVSDLAAGYGNATIIEDVNVAVDAGEVVGIVGPNGAGKSTLMKAIVGIATRERGSISVRGQDVTDLPTHERAKRGVGYLPQQDAIFPEFTVRENLELAGEATTGPTGRSVAFELFPRLRELADRRADVLSGGERKMLAIGCVAMTDPDLYLLDEPSDGLAPNLVSDVFDRIDELRAEGNGILINEQKEQVLDHIDRAYVLQGGRITDRGPAKDLLEEGTIQRTYLQSDV